MTISMGKILATKHNYKTDGDQELLAIGLTNGIAALLGGFCAGAGGSRSFVQDEVGGQTQVHFASNL